jgi:hypothetical protein
MPACRRCCTGTSAVCRLVFLNGGWGVGGGVVGVCPHTHARVPSPCTALCLTHSAPSSLPLPLPNAPACLCCAGVYACSDLNSNNVLVTSLDYATLNVKVSDFGLSRELERDETVTGFVGSPSYIAPEVLSDKAEYDERVDVYSFGILLWSLLQYLHLTKDVKRPRTVMEHHDLMRPYGSAWLCKGEGRVGGAKSRGSLLVVRRVRAGGCLPCP